MEPITCDYISQHYQKIYKTIYDDAIEYAYNYFCESYSKYLSDIASQNNAIAKDMAEIKVELEEISKYISSTGPQFEKVTSSQFLFAENCTAQQKYDFQLKALKYPYDIYAVYNFSNINSEIDKYNEILTNIVLGNNINFFLVVHKFNITSACIDEILDIDDRYNSQQWSEVAKSDKTFLFPKGIMSVIASKINKYGGEFGIIDEELYYTFSISNLVTISESQINTYGESKEFITAKKLSDAFNESDLLNKSDKGKKYSDLFGCQEIADFKLKIESRINTPIKEAAKGIGNEIIDCYSKKVKKRKKVTLIVFVALFVVLISFVSIALCLSDPFETLTFLVIVELLWVCFLVSCLLLSPLFLVNYFKGKSEKKKIKTLSDCNLDCAQTLFGGLCKNLYENGAELVSSRIYVDNSDKETQLIEKSSKIKDVLSTYIDYRDNLSKSIKATTSYLPQIFNDNIRLLAKTYKIMESGTASEYQTALYQAQQEIKQDDLEYDREMREIARQREEEKHRREILESQKRAEEYAKEQAEYAKQQAIAAERQADYERQRLDTERDAAKNAEKLLEEAKRQTEIQRKQQQMYEEERLRMENERNAKKWE